MFEFGLLFVEFVLFDDELEVVELVLLELDWLELLFVPIVIVPPPLVVLAGMTATDGPDGSENTPLAIPSSSNGPPSTAWKLIVVTVLVPTNLVP